MNKINWNSVFFYLCGPIDYAVDAGVGWREEITSKLTNIGINPNNILNPCSKPYSMLGESLSEEQRLVHELRAKEDWKGLSKLMKKIIHIDLRLVDKSDVLIVNLSDSDKTTGTIHEIVLASLMHKPIYIIDTRGKKHVSGWLFGLVGHDRIYDSIDAVINEISIIKEFGPQSERDAKQYLVFDFEKRDHD